MNKIRWRFRQSGDDAAGLEWLRQISLSVERKNFAQKLYFSEGYQIVDSSDRDSDTMVKPFSRRIRQH
jgi:hypothetical protein